MKRYGEFFMSPAGKPISDVLNGLLGEKDDMDVIAIFPTDITQTEFRVITVQRIPDSPKQETPDNDLSLRMEVEDALIDR